MSMSTKIFAVVLCCIFIRPTAFALEINSDFVAPEIQLEYLYQDLSSGGSLDMGKFAQGQIQYTSFFTLHNTGDAVLNISDVSFTGADASLFGTDLSTGVVTAGGNLKFRVYVTSEATGLFSAQLVITSDDADESTFTVNLSAESIDPTLFIDLYGPEDAPPRDLLFSQDGNGIGRPGGLNYRFANLGLAATTPVYWGTFLDAEENLEVKLSMDNFTYEGEEIMAFYPAGSNLSGGILQWIGKTTITDFNAGVAYTAYTRLLITVTYTNSGVPVPLIEPALLKMDNQVGGLVPFTDISDQVSANMRFESSLSFGTAYEPYLEFYDNFDTNPNAEGTASSFWPGYFWNNVAPRLTANASLDIDEGDIVALTANLLTVSDDEDLPEEITIVFEPGTGVGTNPVKHGELKKEGVVMTENDDFSMQDILDGNIVYHHDGSEVSEDNFVFKAYDSRGLYVTDGPYDAFTFRINITIINDPPEVVNLELEANCGETVSGQVTATDDEGETVTFEVVTPPSSGTLDLNPTTGEFTVTGISEAGTILFQYRGYDGNSYSENGNVEITIIASGQTIDFPDPGVVKLSDNTLTLVATTSSGLEVSFTTQDTELLDIAGTTATLLQTGEASVKADQAGDACYLAAESVINTFCIEPDPPTITAGGLGGDSPVLTSSVSVGNQWYKDGTLLSGATASTYVINDQGSYTVTVTENGCESQHSEAFVIIITDLQSLRAKGIELYPNPTRGLIHIRILDSDELARIRIADMVGRNIREWNIAGPQGELDISDLRAGIYHLSIMIGEDKPFGIRIIKN